MPEDMTTQAQEIYDILIEMAVTHGMSVIYAILILVVGFWFATKAKNLVIRGMRKSKKIDETIVIFAGSMVRYLVIIFTVMAVLDQFGVETTSLIALLGAAGLAIGFALQGTLSNIAAGVMLLFFRPFKVGQYVDVGGTAGTVKGFSQVWQYAPWENPKNVPLDKNFSLKNTSPLNPKRNSIICHSSYRKFSWKRSVGNSCNL